MVIDDEKDTLSNLRFADDVLLVATSISDVNKMMIHLADETAKNGLKLNASKTAGLTFTSSEVPASIMVGSDSVEVLGPAGCSKYLGRKLCLAELH